MTAHDLIHPESAELRLIINAQRHNTLRSDHYESVGFPINLLKEPLTKPCICIEYDLYRFLTEFCTRPPGGQFVGFPIFMQDTDNCFPKDGVTIAERW